MKLIDARLSLILFALAALPTQAQEKCPDRGTRNQAPAGTEIKDWDGYNKGVVWKKTIEEAQAESRATGKPIMLFQLVGDLDKEGC